MIDFELTANDKKILDSRPRRGPRHGNTRVTTTRTSTSFRPTNSKRPKDFPELGEVIAGPTREEDSPAVLGDAEHADRIGP